MKRWWAGPAEGGCSPLTGLQTSVRSRSTCRPLRRCPSWRCLASLLPSPRPWLLPASAGSSPSRTSCCSGWSPEPLAGGSHGTFSVARQHKARTDTKFQQQRQTFAHFNILCRCTHAECFSWERPQGGVWLCAHHDNKQSWILKQKNWDIATKIQF